jgi:hypothetical protein
LTNLTYNIFASRIAPQLAYQVVAKKALIISPEYEDLFVSKASAAND